MDRADSACERPMDLVNPEDVRPEDAAPAVEPEDILAVRLGPGANCSSIGSALDLLFLSAAAGGALLVAVAAAFPGPARPPQAARAPRPESPGEKPPAPPPEETDARPT
jgi:hypothetical protein